jgi:peptidoglycan/xylan/chitin deacetylase (PgdA/CDA1 family)
MTPSVAVLAYHKVGLDAWETWFSMPEETFVAQLERLRSSGFRPIDRSAFLRGLDDPGSLPPRAALITFDDAYRSVLDTALPLLERFGFPAVVFVPTAFIGGANDWEDGSQPRERICDWDELLELERRGVAVESHGVTHRSLERLGARSLEHELRGSRAALEERLGRPVELLAFPYGAGGRGRLSSDLAVAGYRAAFLYGGGPFSLPTRDPYRLPRLALGPDSDVWPSSWGSERVG